MLESEPNNITSHWQHACWRCRVMSAPDIQASASQRPAALDAGNLQAQLCRFDGCDIATWTAANDHYVSSLMGFGKTRVESNRQPCPLWLQLTYLLSGSGKSAQQAAQTRGRARTRQHVLNRSTGCGILVIGSMAWALECDGCPPELLRYCRTYKLCNLGCNTSAGRILYRQVAH